MTCLKTFATLRIFSESLSPTTIAEILGVQATKEIPIDPASPYRPRRETNMWAWCSDYSVDSANNLEHIASVITLLKGRSGRLDSLREQGCQIDILCYYVSTGQGGPEMDIYTMKSLVDLGLEIWWDIYFGNEDDYR